ncbi:DNA topoisomerase IB [soil metagenome]
MENILQQSKITKRNIRAIIADPEKTANAVDLVYVRDTLPGIQRIKRGRDFINVYKNKTVKDPATLTRIKSLVLPPAWENVWICNLENGHLQATGLDAKKRKQYRYHSLWSQLRNQTKFYRLLEFGKAMPLIREQIEKDLSLPGLPLKKVLAAVVSLMEHTSIRVGNNMYEKLYGSYGLTTLKDKHVKWNGATMQFSFKGKKGVAQKISITSKRLSRIVKQCKDIPGNELFQYYDEHGKHKCIDSGMVNQYLKDITGKDFTAKDFRTWSGTLHALMAFKQYGRATTKAEAKRNIISALDAVAAHLGNTRTVCKKYYVHPVVISLYENSCLEKYLEQSKAADKNQKKYGLTPEEKVMMRILEKETSFTARSPKPRTQQTGTSPVAWK